MAKTANSVSQTFLLVAFEQGSFAQISGLQTSMKIAGMATENLYPNHKKQFLFDNFYFIIESNLPYL